MSQGNVSPQVFILEDLIRKGQIRQAQSIVREIAQSEVPRSLIRKMASFARRASLPEVGMRLLYPLLERGGVKADGDEGDRAEFAACLARAGATREALALLQRIPPRTVPEAPLFIAFALIGEWRYQEAISPLQDYLRTPSLDVYSQMVAEINLASCHIHEGEFTEAQRLLSRLQKETETAGYLLLYGLTQRQIAIALTESGELPLAREALAQAERALVRAGARDKMFVEKWTVFLDLKKEGLTPALRARCRRLRQQAWDARHWETVRDCDRALLYLAPKPALFQHLYFGTPFESFRRELLNRMGDRLRLPETYDWSPGKSSTPVKTLRLTENAEDSLPVKLKTGDASHRLLLVLCSDFYRPFRTAALFGQIFPGEYFNPGASEIRVRMAVQRLRALMKHHRLPLVIEVRAGEYRLDPKSRVRIRLSAPVAQHGKEDLLFERLKRAVGESEFTTREAAERFDSSPRTVQRLLERALAQGQVIKIGGSRNTRYRWK